MDINSVEGTKNSDSISEEVSYEIPVTVVTVTYNHKDYIRECLDSLVCQKTNFRYQILVGDDCSPDGTGDIVREYAEKYPDKIVPILREENVGSIRNFGDLCERAMAQSKYMAFCDGDDYWIDENRLQKQYDYLENNPELNGCYCRCRFQIDDDWDLSSFYKINSDGEYIWPDCQPNVSVNKEPITVKQMINFLPAMSNNTFLRINHLVEHLPDWFYESYIGDAPFMFLHIGEKKMGFNPDVMSVYRKNRNGVFFSADKDEHFFKTRPEYIKYLSGLRDFFITNYNSFGKVEFENRIKLETYNYLTVLIKYEMTKEIGEFFTNFPEAGQVSLNAYLSFYNDSRKMTRIYSWEGNKVVARDSKFMHLLKPFVKAYIKLRNKKNALKNKIKKSTFLRKARNLARCILYWTNGLIPKNKRHWAFTSFHNNKYMDNSKYYFEYVAENHPEIKAYWFTKNKGVYNELKKKGYNVRMINTLSGTFAMLSCSIAVTDHFRMTDYDPLWGLSDKTKIVQLWHGVGLKSMGDGKDVKNTTVPGVQYSTDILSQEGDSGFTRLRKRFGYIRHAYFRELYEKYFLFVCPGQERIDMIGKIWNIPAENYLMAGHPRNLPVYQGALTEKNSVIYAPTYRANPDFENEMIGNFIENVDVIQKFMEEKDAFFTLRLHPHTWRNYQNKIRKAIIGCSRISFDLSPDIYTTMNDYKVIISDYSSITYDFLMFNRPAVFFCFDYEDFCSRDAGFNLDYMEVTPGPKTYTWEETLEEVGKYLDDPSKDTEWRREVCRYFFDEKANSADNSEVITKEIKNRLKIKK